MRLVKNPTAVKDSTALPLADRVKAQERIDKLLGLENLDVEERLKALEEAMKRKTP